MTTRLLGAAAPAGARHAACALPLLIRVSPGTNALRERIFL